MAGSTEFTVSIQGVALSATQKRELNSAIQKAALSQLAVLGVRGGLGTHFPKEWLGIWIGPIKNYNPRTIEAAIKTNRAR